MVYTGTIQNVSGVSAWCGRQGLLMPLWCFNVSKVGSHMGTATLVFECFYTRFTSGKNIISYDVSPNN